MKIPIKFESILKQNQVLNLVVLDVITTFQPIFDDNKLYFFEEYTDHGIKHIESVLESAEFIISDDSFQYLTPNDVAILILSIILHDIGMHVEFGTFTSLLNGEYDNYRIDILDKRTWNELWTEYLTEVKRYSSAQKKNIFGDEYQKFQEPNLSNKDKLEGYDKKLIGEFIRIHHGRFAHEVAFGGLIGQNKQILQFGNEKLSILFKHLIGILARSHSQGIRDSFIYLEDIANQGWRNPGDINIIFLMVVLRIADYIQINNTRVNNFLLKLKTFNSPISLKEHQSHLAIDSISFNQPDSERIYVSCSPQNSEMLTKLSTLFTDIQKELDISWAVLGEVYGFIPHKKPYIKFRRIVSNLEEKSYLDKLHFVPKKIVFEVSPELSKLLVGPLYGNDPKFGVRELVQNSVDACNERSFLETKKGNSTYIPKIVVEINEIDEDSSSFSISDNGKGMTLDEIMHYFLKVGASFRKSLSWKKEFVDDEGHSNIARNGKFGIGVLAAFLIGEELTVETNHYSNKILYSFKTNIDSQYIEIIKTNGENKKIGTTISLTISKNKREELLHSEEDPYNRSKEILWYQWYVYDKPEIEYFVDGKKLKIVT